MRHFHAFGPAGVGVTAAGGTAAAGANGGGLKPSARVQGSPAVNGCPEETLVELWAVRWAEGVGGAQNGSWRRKGEGGMGGASWA